VKSQSQACVFEKLWGFEISNLIVRKFFLREDLDGGHGSTSRENIETMMSQMAK